MTPEKEQELYKKFPNLYKSKCGFSCGDGWFDLIYDLSQQLEHMILAYIETNLSEEEMELIPYAVQVKEKFAGARFYMSAYLDHPAFNEMSVYIREFEDKSYEICEECGKPGKGRSLPWVRTLCEEHYKESRNIYYNRAKDDYIKYKKKFEKTGDQQYEKLILTAKEKMAMYQ